MYQPHKSVTFQTVMKDCGTGHKGTKKTFSTVLVPGQSACTPRECNNTIKLLTTLIDYSHPQLFWVASFCSCVGEGSKSLNLDQ